MRYLSLFSGIEACSVAWKPLGWQCVGVAEIEKFPAAVLAHHYPDVPNLGDVTKITDAQIAALGPIDLVVGGSPCQDLSVAGKRAGLEGERSSLFHEQVRIFHAARHLCGATKLLWENVPGAFSSNGGRDFAVVVGKMAGCELAVPEEGWGTEGLALGEHGLVEWAVLDAQWFGVAQRRRRVFALLDAGDWADRPPILLEPDRLRGDSAPRREAGEGPAAGSLRSSDGGSDVDHGKAGHLIPATVGALTDGAHNGGGSTARTPTQAASSLLPEVAWRLQERDAKGADSNTKPGHLIPVIGGGFDVAHALTGNGHDASEDGTGRGTPIVPVIPIQNATRGRDQNGLGIGGDVMFTLDQGSQHAVGFVQNQRDEVRTVAVAGALAAEPGAKQQTYIAFSAKDHGADASPDVAPTLRSMGHDGSHANGGGQVAVAIGADCYNGALTGDVAATLGTGGSSQNSAGPQVAVAFHNRQDPDVSGEVTHPLGAQDNGMGILQEQPYTLAIRGRGDTHNLEYRQDGTANALLTPNGGRAGIGVGAIATHMQVRRLTPRECGRLQGFPDDYTLIPWRKKPASECPDGPRYKALGNSMARPVMRWIGTKIDEAARAADQTRREHGESDSACAEAVS